MTWPFHLRHVWGWPRRHGAVDVQTCNVCGARRRALEQFGAPLVKYSAGVSGGRAARLGAGLTRQKGPALPGQLGNLGTAGR